MSRQNWSAHLSFYLLVGLFISACSKPLTTDGAAVSPTTFVGEQITSTAAPAEIPLPLATELPAAAIVQPLPTAAVATSPTAPAGAAAIVSLPTPSGAQYVLQSGSPSWMPNIFHPEEGCNWMGVAGFVFDVNNQPVEELIVEAGGMWEGQQISLLTLTGVAPVYGAGAYDLPLSDHSAASSGDLWIQVENLEGQELSSRVFFDTFAGCDQNVVMINFVQAVNQEGNTHFYLPLLILEKQKK